MHTSLRLKASAGLLTPMSKLHFSIVLAVLWYQLAYGQAKSSNCSDVTICVISDNRDDCLLSTNDRYNISNLPQRACRLHLTGGIHILTKNMDFDYKMQNVTIAGSSSDERSIVLCKNGSGISFNGGIAHIANVTFKNCSRNQIVTNTNIEIIALLFTNTSYTLENVAVVETMGYSLYAYRSQNQTIRGCKFEKNNGPAIINNAYTRIRVQVILILKSSFTDGSGEVGRAAGLEVEITKSGELNISDCIFHSNKGINASHLLIVMKTKSAVKIHIGKCTFTEGGGKISTFGAVISSKIKSKENCVQATIQTCNFTDNRYGAIQILALQKITIDNSVISSNNGTGVFINSTYESTISNSNFSSNYKALFLNLTSTGSIIGCVFANHILSSVPPYHDAKEVVHIKGDSPHTITIKKSSFTGNEGIYGNCSSLNITNMENVTLDNVDFVDNYCTGIALTASHIYIRNKLNITRNLGMFGGGIYMKRMQTAYSRITLKPHAKVLLINNVANAYGGGVFTDENCEQRSEERDCLFSLEKPTSPAIHFAGNTADLGGDAIFGGCVHNCRMKIMSADNITSAPLTDFLSLEDNYSLSVLADLPKKVVFCVSSNQNPTYHTSDELTAFRGEVFTIHLMVIDDFCTPSSETIQAIVTPEKNSFAQLQQGQLYLGKKNCENYTFSIRGAPHTDSVIVQLFPQKQLIALNAHPAQLKVHLKDCPAGFVLTGSPEQCTCRSRLSSYKIKCTTTDYSIQVPPWTWIGDFGGRTGVNKDCQHCKNEGEHMLQDAADPEESRKLCTRNRTGILCGACVHNYSLQLGVNSCAYCTGSSYKGVLLLILFAAIGILLILALLGLNLTVSTGLINGLIFYSNIVHANSDIFLPINRDMTTHLQNAVRFLSTFQAWINLDFGIKTCFFDNYNTYISMWTQFAFPMYIWLLILILVFVSRYSSKVSRLTGSSTVPVLATLMVLSYTKLLLTLIAVSSNTKVDILEELGKYYTVWAADGNIPYLRGKHIPLFLISCFMALFYILPFTLLIVFGPLMQAKSNYRLLHWIHRIKPFHDACYGPYNSLYRYWPGLLLLARLVLFSIFAFYSDGSVPFKLATILAMATVLLVTWNVLGRSNTISPHQKYWLNYLELFFHFNLTFFTTTTIYFRITRTSIHHQQILAVIMVGAVFIVFCGIVVYRILSILLARCKLARKIANVIQIRRKESAEVEPPCESEDYLNSIAVASSVTHSTVGTESIDSTIELREPLLTGK